MKKLVTLILMACVLFTGCYWNCDVNDESFTPDEAIQDVGSTIQGPSSTYNNHEFAGEGRD